MDQSTKVTIHSRVLHKQLVSAIGLYLERAEGSFRILELGTTEASLQEGRMTPENHLPSPNALHLTPNKAPTLWQWASQSFLALCLTWEEVGGSRRRSRQDNNARKEPMWEEKEVEDSRRRNRRGDSARKEVGIENKARWTESDVAYVLKRGSSYDHRQPGGAYSFPGPHAEEILQRC
ncbi:hypothetical protein PoB_005422800 [Plakobranchus ocellatus]|uniref:Uncharacterized protein n=1 Tax=Plakobranchus ocellatus TaxID=259542 RepID=A0AAV4C880_9GAST|nr:hypothetical protein PoB_005422800 [Plakobranchus ocellatus]